MTAPDARRRLGAPTLAGLVVANMVGAGLFTTSGFALADLGTPDRVLAAWAVGGGIAVLGVLCYGSLAVHLRESGGEYLFLSRTLHPAAGFLAGWISLIAGFGGAIAFAAEALQAYVAPWLPAGMPADLVGTVLIAAVALLHAAGLGPGVIAQNAAVAVKLTLLVALAAWGAWALAAGGPDSGAAAADGTAGPVGASAPPPFDAAAFVVTLMWISLSYSGWNAAVYVTGEVRNPSRVLPRAMLAGTLAVTALYLALNAVFVHAAPVTELAGRADVAAAATDALGGEAMQRAVRIGMALAMLTSISSMIMIGPRVPAQMADDGLLPRPLRFTGTVPRAAIALQAAVAIAFLWASGLRAQMTNLGWILSLCTAAAIVGLLRQRRRLGAEAVPVPGHPWVPLAFLAATLGITGALVVVRGAELAPAAAVLGSGVLLYAAFRPRRRGGSPPGGTPR